MRRSTNSSLYTCLLCSSLTSYMLKEAFPKLFSWNTTEINWRSEKLSLRIGQIVVYQCILVHIPSYEPYGPIVPVVSVDRCEFIRMLLFINLSQQYTPLPCCLAADAPHYFQPWNFQKLCISDPFGLHCFPIDWNEVTLFFWVAILLLWLAHHFEWCVHV